MAGHAPCTLFVQLWLAKIGLLVNSLAFITALKLKIPHSYLILSLRQNLNADARVRRPQRWNLCFRHEQISMSN